MARTSWARRTGSIIAAAAVGVGLASSPALAAVTGTVDVAAGNTLTVRSTPSTSGTAVASLADGASVSISCSVTGTTVTGTFGTTNQWDKLSNGYVSHAFVRTTVAVPACAPPPPPASTTGTVDVAAGATLSVRSTPSTTGTKVGSLADGATITILCYTTGSSVTGTFGTTTRWDKISTGYVSHAYVSGAAGAAACSSTPPPPPPPSGGNSAVVNAALSMVGRYPYVYAGGNYYGPTTGVDNGHPEDVYTTGFDCSGLMQYAFYQGAGYKIPERISRYMYTGGQSRGQLVPLSQRRAGDVGFSANNTSDPNTIYHVYLFTSPTAIVHASDHDTDITTKTNWSPTTGKTMPYVLRPLP